MNAKSFQDFTDEFVFCLRNKNNIVISMCDNATRLSGFDNPKEVVGLHLERTILRDFLHMENKIDNKNYGRFFHVISYEGRISNWHCKYKVHADGNISTVSSRVQSTGNGVMALFDAENDVFVWKNGAKISTAEMATVYYYVIGYSYKDIARRLSISEKTVDRRLRVFADKIDVDGVKYIRYAMFVAGMFEIASPDFYRKDLSDIIKAV